MLKDILSISGQPGLFKMISKGNNAVIVESLINGKRFPAYSTSKILTLEDIAIYTKTGEIQLREVFKKIVADEELKKGIDPKSPTDKLKTYFKRVLPDYDEDRVYVSDIKKLVQWYLMLTEKDLLNLDDAPEEKSEEEPKEKSE